jgi:hypothetical protein
MATQSQAQSAAPKSPAETLTDMIVAYRMSQLIYVAARLGIADLLQDGPKRSEALAAQVGVHPQALYRVLRALANQGIFAESADRHFSLTPLAEPLRTAASDSVHGFALMQNLEPRWRAWGNLLYSVHTGQSAFEHVHGMSNWAYYASDPDLFEQFHEGMAELTQQTASGIVAAYDFAEAQVVVDVGGGRGHLMAKILEQNPQLRGVIVEVPALIEEARQVLEDAGVAARCDCIAGDYMAALPKGGDVYLLKSIIHGMTEDNAIRLLGNCRRSTANRGRLLVIQVIVPPWDTPARIKLNDILHLVEGGGRERTEDEYRALFDAAGFRLAQVYPTATGFSILEGVLA